MRIFAKTDKGKVRSVNQDAFAANVLSGGAAFAVVCDGMGGASAGDIASKTAVEIISQYVLASYNPSMTSDDIIKLLSNAIASANIEVYTLSKMLEDGNNFKKTVASWLGKEYDFDKNRKNLEDFCTANLIRGITKEKFDEFRNLVVAAYKEAGFKEAQASRNGSMQANALNKRLQEMEIPFIIHKINFDDTSGNKSIDYWIICEVQNQ